MMKRLLSFLQIILLISPLVTLTAEANERQIQCKVVGISDGDTLTCLQDRKQLKVRLQHIDAPELAQPFGNKAKQALANLVFKKQVMIKTREYDRYGRLLGVVYDNGQNINLALVQQGMAWAYRQTEPMYEQAQSQAKTARKGLWQDLNPVDPADWRKQKQVNRQSNDQASTQANSPFRLFKTEKSTQVNNRHSQTLLGNGCQKKLTCSSFSHYNDAYRYFKQCNATYMDGNGDGIPCNRLYRKMKRNQ